MRAKMAFGLFIYHVAADVSPRTLKRFSADWLRRLRRNGLEISLRSVRDKEGRSVQIREQNAEADEPEQSPLSWKL